MSSEVSQTPLVIVSASRCDASSFATATLLGQSLAAATHQQVEQRIAFANREPLAKHYNAAIAEASPESLIVFCHDDVWLGDQPLAAPLVAALQRFDLIGVAGNARLLPGHSTWWRRPDSIDFDFPHLVGSIQHGSPQQALPSTWGPSPAPAALLDGVFLAARAGSLQKAGLCFDPDLPFHFYDLDFCRSALAAGLRLGVWPLPLIHASKGSAGSPSWQASLESYRRK